MKQPGTARKASIDLGLAIAECHARRGAPMTCREIAAFCGCHHNRIFQIEHDARRRLQIHLKSQYQHLKS